MKYRKICDCECHEIGVDIRHCFPCCSFTYMKYLDDGFINIYKFIGGFADLTGEMPTVKFELGEWYWLSEK